MVARAETLGCEVVRLKSDRLSGLPDAHRDAKTTRAIISTSPSRRLEPIPPSAHWRADLAGTPIVRAYANLAEIPATLETTLGCGAVTSGGVRASEGTT